MQPTTREVSFSQAFKVWARIGLLSFGGPAGQIALMHRELVDERKWLTEKEFLSALNFCMLLPGPEAMQLTTYAGWKLHGTKGGLAAGLLFILPGAAAVLALSMIYGSFGALPWVAAIFYGVKAAVLAIVIEALLRVAKRALKGQVDWLIAAAAFAALYFFGLPFPLLIAAAAFIGWFRNNKTSDTPVQPLPSISAIAPTVATWLVIWLVPFAAIRFGFGPQHVFSQVALFFSKLAVVTFGGAYAVLSYMAQAAVEQKHWLTGPEMVDGLGLAETTPGPLILVTQFVGYLAGLRQIGSVWGGLAAVGITLWMTFAPCFLWVLSGAPYVEAISQRPRLASALAAITAAVVGVIANLTLWFALHVIFVKVERLPGMFRPWVPDVHSVDLWALALSLIAGITLLRFHLGLPKTLALMAALGLVVKLLT